MPPETGGAPAPEAATTQVASSDTTQSGGSSQGGGTEGQQAPATKDPAAAMRYQISREKAEKARIQKEFEEFKARASQPSQKFDPTSDPDGTKEIQHLAELKAQEVYQKNLKESGLAERIEAFEYEQKQKEFFEHVEKEFDTFKKLGIDAPTRQEMMDTLKVIADEGVTPQQLIAIAKFEQVFGRLKPTGFTPGEGGKQETNRELTQAEVNAQIYAKHGVFGYGR